MGAHGSNLDDILEEDMHHWYTKFMRESPSGLITLFELKAILEMNSMTEEASSYVDQIFLTFDMDGVRKRLHQGNGRNNQKRGTNPVICHPAEEKVADYADDALFYMT